MKNQKGITLIALVVTIVVLLILAGITITLVLSDDGIFGKAQEAQTAMDGKDLQEQIQLALVNAKTDLILQQPSATEAIGIVEDSIDAALPDSYGNATFEGTNVTITDGKYSIDTTVTVTGTEKTYAAEIEDSAIISFERVTD